jgi:hypothetical protein
VNIFLKILLFIWELPQTLLACIIIIFTRKKVVRKETFGNTKIFYAKNFPGGISLGRFIILNSMHASDEMIKKHEYGHSIQSMYLGWLYLIIVGLPSIIRVAIWKLLKLESYSYYRGYPEKWADKLVAHRKEITKRP